MYVSLYGQGPDRERCPVEHRGEIPSVHTSIRPFVRTFPPGLAQAAQRLVQAGLGHQEAGFGYLEAGLG